VQVFIYYFLLFYAFNASIEFNNFHYLIAEIQLYLSTEKKNSESGVHGFSDKNTLNID